MIITQKEQELLVKQSELKELYTNEYLSNKDNENLKLIADLFFNDDIERAKQFNIWSNLFTTITDTIANFVWNPVTDLKLDLTEYVRDLVSVWQCVFWVKRVDDWSINGQLQLYYLPAEDVIYSNNEYKLVKIYSNIEWNKTNYYMLKQVFWIGYIESKLYKLLTPTAITWEEVELTRIKQTASLQPYIETWLNRPAIFFITDVSLLNKIKGLIYSLDRKLVMFETQFLWEIEQYKIFENIAIPQSAIASDWTVSMAKMPKVLATDTTMWNWWDIKYISNQNPLIQDAIQYEQTQLRKVSSATGIPLDFLWVQDWWAVSWTSREILLQAFIKKIEYYRVLFTDCLIDILTLFQANGNKKDDWTEIETSIIWNAIITKSDKELIDELAIARQNGLISQYTWVKLYLWLREEQDIQNELELIKSEWNTIILNSQQLSN